jgi:hypothetical protein
MAWPLCDPDMDAERMTDELNGCLPDVNVRSARKGGQHLFPATLTGPRAVGSPNCLLRRDQTDVEENEACEDDGPHVSAR